jgi:hypothetical protein
MRMKKTSTPFLLIGILMFMTIQTFPQVGINSDNSSPDPSAGLDVNFTDKGVLIPRLTLEQRNAIQNPAEGLFVYCTTCNLKGTGVISIFQGGVWKIINLHCYAPNQPAAGTHRPDRTQIIWNWNNAPIALGYKWNTSNNWATATDMGTSTTKTETGLTCNTPYTRYVWAYNACGYSPPDTLTQTTTGCQTCGTSITINHIAGAVAPVTKTVTYGIVTNIPGLEYACWIASNLGADHQATAVDDASEASAGWYWQFNRKQGYKHDGTTRTPNTTWMSIDENSDWIAANDPCTIELGSGWHIPTQTEWTYVNEGGGWTDWNGPWNSGLKMHAAGGLDYYDGSLDFRGYDGLYYSNTQYGSTTVWYLEFDAGDCNVLSLTKSFGCSARCVITY